MTKTKVSGLEVSGRSNFKKDAKFRDDVQVKDDLTVKDDLKVYDKTRLKGVLSVHDAANLDSTLSVAGATTLTSTLSVGGNAHVTGSLGYKMPVVALPAANTNILASQSGTLFTFGGTQAAAVTYTLPTPSAGLNYTFVVSSDVATNNVTITAGTGIINGMDIAGGGTNPALIHDSTVLTFVNGQALQGDYVELKCTGTRWIAVGYVTAAGAFTQ